MSVVYFFPYLATGRRPVARLFGTVLCTCTKSTKQGLADDGKIGFSAILYKNSYLTLFDAARDRTGVTQSVSVTRVTQI